MPSSDLPNIQADAWQPVDSTTLAPQSVRRSPEHPPSNDIAPRILVLYGSLRARSYSRFLAEEAARVLRALGCTVELFDPSGLPLPDDADADHPRVAALRDQTMRADGMVWVSPERHGAMTAVMKAQIDWLPLSLGGMRPTQGKTLALMQVSGGSQSFNAVNQMRLLGRWMRMVTIPNQSSVPKAFGEFDETGRMHDSPLYRRVVDVCEELVKFTWLLRGHLDYLTDRYSERVESAADVSARVSAAATRPG